MTAWRRDTWLHVLLLYASLSVYEPVWRLLVQGLLQGEAFTWAVGPLSGQGLAGHYWLLLLVAGLGVAVIYFGLRGGRWPFHILLPLWGLVLVAETWYMAAARATVHVEFAGLALPAGLSLMAVDVLFLLLATAWGVRDRRSGRRVETVDWTPLNGGFLILAVLMLPLIFAWFHFSEPGSGLAQAGALVIFSQWLVINAAFFPWPRSWVEAHL